MQKKLIALAIAGLSSAAFAQSNVTVYGVADATFDMVKASSSTTSTENIGQFNRVSTNSSLIGFKGAEDLGNGLKAVFQFESGVSFDAAGALGATRDSFVGLSSGFGTVVLGNLTGPTRALAAAVDVNAGATGIGANSGLVGKLGGNLVGGLNSAAPIVLGSNEAGTRLTAAGAPVVPTAGCGRSSTCTSTWDTRFQNAIAYVSPSFGGVTVTAAYVANENKTQNDPAVLNVAVNNGAIGASTANAKSNTRAYDVGATYNNGPIMVGITYADARLGGNVIDAEAKEFRLAGKYTFGPAAISAFYGKTKMDLTDATGLFGGNGDLKQNVYGLGGSFNVTPAGKIIGQYYVAKDVKGSLGGADTGAKLWEIGYEHSLSKRTVVKAVYAQLNNDTNAVYDFGINAVGISPATTAGIPVGTGTGAGSNLSGFQFGVRHSF